MLSSHEPKRLSEELVLEQLGASRSRSRRRCGAIWNRILHSQLTESFIRNDVDWDCAAGNEPVPPIVVCDAGPIIHPDEVVVPSSQILFEVSTLTSILGGL